MNWLYSESPLNGFTRPTTGSFSGRSFCLRASPNFHFSLKYKMAASNRHDFAKQQLNIKFTPLSVNLQLTTLQTRLCRISVKKSNMTEMKGDTDATTSQQRIATFAGLCFILSFPGISTLRKVRNLCVTCICNNNSWCTRTQECKCVLVSTSSATSVLYSNA